MTQKPVLTIVSTFDLATDPDFNRLQAAYLAATAEFPETLDRFMEQNAGRAAEIFSRLHREGGEARELAKNVLKFLSENPTEGIKWRGAVTEWGPLRVRGSVERLFNQLPREIAGSLPRPTDIRPDQPVELAPAVAG